MTIKRACSEQTETGERWADAELHRLEGEAKLARNDQTGARKSFEDSLRIAGEQGSTVLRGRAEQALSQL